MGLLAVIGPSTKRNNGLSARSFRSFSKASESRQKVRISSSSAGASNTGGTDSNLFMGSINDCHTRCLRRLFHEPLSNGPAILRRVGAHALGTQLALTSV